MIVRVSEDGKIVEEGDQILIGGNETYISLCRKHFFSNILNKILIQKLEYLYLPNPRVSVELLLGNYAMLKLRSLVINQKTFQTGSGIMMQEF